ncbi:DUF3549 family protein [Candidatus Njordibacter sp. Uisw_056]|uniref:DUF3549 family protein n=1 Tax=Candidatus Njordibacter sp. Uisw_056 TaxID=3230973 RepID=UPI003D4E4138
MQPMETLSDLLQQLQGQYRIYDMGCRLSKLSSTDFKKFEEGQKAYPLPWLRHAWVSILSWSPKSLKLQASSPTVWFLKLPLDERGLLIQAARDEFLNQLLETIGTNMLDEQASSEWAEQLKHSNLAFTPDQARMAAFHAQASITLDQPASRFYPAVRSYMSSEDSQQNWQELGLQGFADFAMRLDQQQQWQQKISQLPAAVLETIAAQLENQKLDHLASKAFILRGEASINNAEKVACLRAISQSTDAASRQHWLKQILDKDNMVEVELLATITSKCSDDLLKPDLMDLFIHQCAADQGVFNGLVQELMYQPKLRIKVLEAFRAEDRSPRVIQAIGILMGQKKA